MDCGNWWDTPRGWGSCLEQDQCRTHSPQCLYSLCSPVIPSSPSFTAEPIKQLSPVGKHPAALTASALWAWEVSEITLCGGQLMFLPDALCYFQGCCQSSIAACPSPCHGTHTLKAGLHWTPQPRQDPREPFLPRDLTSAQVPSPLGAETPFSMADGEFGSPVAPGRFRWDD